MHWKHALSPRKLHPLLEEKDLKNDRLKNFFFLDICSTHDPDTTEKNTILPDLLLFFTFCLLKQTIILSDLKGVFYQSCRFCISKPNWCVPIRELIFKNDILRVSSCT